MRALAYDPLVDPMTAPILVVDDDAKIVRLVRTYLEREGFRVVEASDGRSALAAIALEAPALVVLDLMLPEVDGLSILRAVRRTDRTPIVMLSARGTTADRIAGLTEGADDYLPKPFSPAELVVRIKRDPRTRRPAGRRDAPRRRSSPAATSSSTATGTRRRSPGRSVELTALEFRLLAALLEADGRVLLARPADGRHLRRRRGLRPRPDDRRAGEAAPREARRRRRAAALRRDRPGRRLPGRARGPDAGVA